MKDRAYGIPSASLAWLLLALSSAMLPKAAPDSRWTEGPGFRRMPIDPTAFQRQEGSRSEGFSEVPPSVSQVRFGNPLPEALMGRNHNFLNGSGVAAGDFDGDGWCDLYFAAISGTNALYRNLGNWRFEDVTTRATAGLPGLHSTGALFADTDADGDLDLLVATLGRGVRCLENKGEGRFRDITTQAGLGADTGSTTLAMADVDGDGDLDLYVANYGEQSILRSGGRAEMRLVDGEWELSGPHAERLRLVEGRLEEVGEPDVLYLNDGRGRFHPLPWESEFFRDERGEPTAKPWDFGLTVQMRDLNGDRAPDIYVCNDFQTVDRIWINDGGGRFRALPRLAMRKQSFSSMGVDFADFDRDGHFDFFVTEMMSRDHRLRMRQIVGMAPLVPEPGRIENRPEVVRNTLFLNRGDGTFVELARYSGVAASDWSWQPIFLDVDLDGFEDILVGNGTLFDVQDRDVLNRIRSFGRQTPEQSRTNLLLYPRFVTANVAWRNRRDLTFEDASETWGFDAARIAQGLAQADLDNDGDLDLAINGVNDGALLLRNETAAPRIAVRLRGRGANPQGVGGLIRVTGGAVSLQMQEILCGGHYLSCGDTVRVFAAGTATNDLTIKVHWRGGATTIVPHALPNQLYEIREPLTESTPLPKPSPATPIFRDVSHLLGHSHRDPFHVDYARQPLLTRQLSQLGPGVAWFDLDGDGQEELFVGDGKGGAPEGFRPNGTNRFDRVTTSKDWSNPDDLTGLAGWVSAEGTRGLLAGRSRIESAELPAVGIVRADWAPSQALTVRPFESVPATRNSVGPLAVADLDGDGDLDLFVGGRCVPGTYPTPASSAIFRQQPDGLHLDSENSRTLANIGLVSGAVWSDLSGDGYPELVLACEWGPIRVFHNRSGLLVEVTAPLGLASATGWWNGVTTGDFDGDGQLDIVASNWGLNGPGRPSHEHPLRLYYGDLMDSGVIDLIETAYVPELGADAPIRTLNALSQAFPVLLERFPSHRAFGNATADDLLQALPYPARSVSATTFASTLFLNRGARFVARPLPPEAQFAPAFSLNVGDFDADGREDLFLSQNFFALRPELPRLDGGRGLWLRGDGRGGLTPIPGQESGVRVYGEQRGAALADFDADGRVDLVVTQNGATTRLFHNTSRRRGLRVRLIGPPGNPAAVGAVIRLGTSEGFGPARELHAGSGYWSQDSAVQVLGAESAARKLVVRWPGGHETVSAIPERALEISVTTDGGVRQMPVPPAEAGKAR